MALVDASLADFTHLALFWIWSLPGAQKASPYLVFVVQAAEGARPGIALSAICRSGRDISCDI